LHLLFPDYSFQFTGQQIASATEKLKLARKEQN